MSEIKFTSDGKKVIIVGKLNSQETIVQEIFVSGDAEIPSGENFVVKSLHDAPVVSWKENRLKELEERYDKEYKSWNAKIDSLNTKYRRIQDELQNRLSYSADVLNNVSPESFQTLVMFISGKMKWIVQTQYLPEIMPIEDFHSQYDGKLRLISIFGRDNGTLTYARGDYSDYSGGQRHFIPFEDYDSAFQYFKDLLLKQGPDDSSIPVAKKYNISFPPEQIEAYKKKKIETLEKVVVDYSKAVESHKLKILEVQSL